MNWYKKAQNSNVTWEDSRGQVMWIKGDILNSPLTWREMKEAITMKNQTSGSVSKEIDGIKVKFIPPFKIRDNEGDEDIEVESAVDGGASASPCADQVYSRYDVIQNRDDLAPSMIRKRKKKRKGKCKGGCKL